MKYANVVVESQYLPCLEYFVLMKNAVSVTIDPFEHYIKQTYRNRCTILGANGTMDLAVPVVGGRKKIILKELRIDNSQSWQKVHWRSLRSAYGKSPFYEYYADGFEMFFTKQYMYLFDLNHDLLSYCLALLSYNISILYSDNHITLHDVDYQHYKSHISPKSDYAKRNIYQECRYLQLFGVNFVPNLSIIDLIMCEGPRAGAILSKSDKKVD